MKGHPALRRLEVLVGEWDVQTIIESQDLGRVWSTFEWVEGGAFLVQRTDADLPDDIPDDWKNNAPFPVTSIIGLDDTSDRFTMLYSDGREVYRVYEMSLNDGVWKIWRNVPGFHQRFEGTFSEDGRTITAHWDFSPDGETWRKDFDLVYTKAK